MNEQPIETLTRPFSTFRANDGLHCLKDANGVVVLEESYIFRTAAEAAARRRSGVKDKLVWQTRGAPKDIASSA